MAETIKVERDEKGRFKPVTQTFRKGVTILGHAMRKKEVTIVSAKRTDRIEK